MSLRSSFSIGNTGGSAWYLGGLASGLRGVSTYDIETECGVTNVQNFLSDGANGASYDVDDFMGVKFRAQASDGNTYDYVVGMQGATNTVVVNTRVAVSNLAPIANAGPDQSVTSGATITVNGSASSDPENQELTYAWLLSNGASFTGVNPSFTLPIVPYGSSPVVYSVYLTVNDGLKNSIQDTMILTVNPAANTVPVANAGPDQVVVSGAPVQLDGSASSDVDSQALTYIWLMSDSSVFTDVSPIFNAPIVPFGADPVVITAFLDVHDGVASSTPDTMTITVNPEANTAPVANAGLDQVVTSGATVSLDGSASSDTNNQALTYAWDGTGTTLTGSKPSFTAPVVPYGSEPVVVSISLVVNDGLANSATDTMTVTVNPGSNTSPIADAGIDQEVISGATVMLDGSTSSDVDGQTLTYNWTGMDTGPLTGSKPSFTAPVVRFGEHPALVLVSLVVNDGFVNSAEDIMFLSVNPGPNTAPTANAGADQVVSSGAMVSLDGSLSSDEDGHRLSYTWTGVGEDSLSDVDVMFAAPIVPVGADPVVLTISLIVGDGYTNSVADTMTVTVNPTPNTAPVANAGLDQVVISGATVELDGSSSSDVDGQTLTYTWNGMDAGPITGSKPSFTAPTVPYGAEPIVVSISLAVNDGLADSTSDVMQVTVNPASNTAPIAAAGPDQVVTSGATITVDGSGSSDAEGQSLTYAWLLSNGATFTGVSPSFTLPEVPFGSPPTVYSVYLKVSDGVTTSTEDTMMLTVNPAGNAAPIANAGDDQIVTSGATVTLNGSASSDLNGQSLTYAWSGPGAPLTGSTPSFTAPTLAIGDAPMVMTISLVVNDGLVNSEADTMTVTVNPMANNVPIANAGGNKIVASGAEFTLDGSASNDIDGQTLTYTWFGLEGETANGEKINLIAPVIAFGEPSITVTGSLVVNDGFADSVPDVFTVTITPAEQITPVDATAPVIATPEDQVAIASSTSESASVDVTSLGSASDAVDGAVAVVYKVGSTVLSGAYDFPIGATVVTMDATDAAGNAAPQAHFTMTVTAEIVAVPADVVAPEITAPADQVAIAVAGATTASVDVTAFGSAVDAVDGAIAVVYKVGNTVLTGAYDFPIGATVVTMDATDAAGNAAIQAHFTMTVNAEIIVVDTQAPTQATTTSVTTNPDGSISITGFAESGSTVEVTFPDGSTISVVASASGSFTLKSAPNQPSGDVKIVVVDAAGNRSEVLSVGFVAQPTVAQTQELIMSFVQNRANDVLSAQPDLTGLLSGTFTGRFNADVTQSNGSFDIATSSKQPVWALVQGSWSNYGSVESSYFFGAVGAHTQLSPEALIGLMVEFDESSQTDGTSTTDGSGYLVGPYFVAKVPDHPLFVEGRFLTGKTSNDVSVDGITTEAFETRRTLATVKVSGELDYNTFTLMPSLSVMHLQDTQDAFFNNQGNIVDGQGIAVNEVAAGLNVSKPVSLPTGELVMTGGVSTIFSSSDVTGATTTSTAASDGTRGRVTLGGNYTMSNGMILKAGTFYDGIGLNGYESYGLDLGFLVEF